ncbi:hypothetical protein [Caloranaerobacter sp. DY30410]|uniref:hypothetical protein n=1 Tax=Caloranaerobacter sp. DY30410 TaxID=3238305 RepID=UPI003D06FCEE
MFNNVFKELKKLFPHPNYAMSDIEWEYAATHLSDLLHQSTVQLIKSAKNSFTLKPFDKMKHLEFWIAKPAKEIAASVLIPKEMLNENDEYFNSDGDNCPGMSIRVSLIRDAFLEQGILDSNMIFLRFSVLGSREFEAFKEFYLNYRRMIELLIQKIDLHFSFCSFDDNDNTFSSGNLSYKNSLDLIKSMDKVFLNSNEIKNFCMQSFFNENSSYESVLLAFKILIALLDSSYHYYTKRKDKDRILKHYNILK